MPEEENTRTLAVRGGGGGEIRLREDQRYLLEVEQEGTSDAKEEESLGECHLLSSATTRSRGRGVDKKEGEGSVSVKSIVSEKEEMREKQKTKWGRPKKLKRDQLKERKKKKKE